MRIVLTFLKLLVLIPWYFIKHRFLEPKADFSEVSTVGFFHVPAHANGGGEKVLWAMVEKLVQENKALKSIKSSSIGNRKPYQILIYCDVLKDKQGMIDKVNSYFGYNFKLSDFKLVELQSAHITYTENYFVMNRFLEGLSHFLVAGELIDSAEKPDVLVESFTGHFSSPMIKMLSPKTKFVSYIHYPYTGDYELEKIRVRLRNPEITWQGRIKCYLHYVYQSFMNLLYSLIGGFSDVCWTNSTWTDDHMTDNWGKGVCQILYPPCNVEEFWQQKDKERKKVLVSFAQYRTEKRQDLQLDIWKHFMEAHPDSQVQFKIIGSSKFEESEKIFNHLQNRIKKEKIKNVSLLKNLNLAELKKTLKEATFGIHTMIDEHFGISITEMLAAGLVTLAHNSAGPKNDILGNKTHEVHGYLAEDDEDFKTKLTELINNYYEGKPDQKKAILDRIKQGQTFAKEHLSNQAFADKFLKKIQQINDEIKEQAKLRKSQAQKEKKRKSKYGDEDL